MNEEQIETHQEQILQDVINIFKKHKKYINSSGISELIFFKCIEEIFDDTEKVEDPKVVFDSAYNAAYQDRTINRGLELK